MSYTIPDYIGLIGVTITLVAYLLISARKMNPVGIIYPGSNAFGSLLIIYSLYFKWNPASAWMEICWLLISLYGVYQGIFHHRNNRLKRKKD